MPSTISWPLSIGSSRFKHRIRVLLPEPLGPAMTIFSPSHTSRLIPRRTCSRPNDLCTLRKLMSGSVEAMFQGGLHLRRKQLERAPRLLECQAAEEERSDEVVRARLAQHGPEFVPRGRWRADQQAALGQLGVEVHPLRVAVDLVGDAALDEALGEVVHEMAERGPRLLHSQVVTLRLVDVERKAVV